MWITCELVWCFYQLFGLSFWRHPFTAEDPWVSKWCNDKFPQICSDELMNKLIHILDDPRLSKCIADLNFGVNYSFKIEVQILYGLLDVFHFWTFLKLRKYKHYITCWMHHIFHPDHPRPVIISACIIELITMDDQTRQKNTVNPTAEILHSHQCQIKHLNIVFVYERKSQMATLYAPVIMPVGNRCKEATGRRPAAHRTQLLALKLLNSCSNWEDI